MTPGAIYNTVYDIGGLAVSGDDGQGHGVTIQLAANTNSSLPGTILPTGSTNMQSTIGYSTAWQATSNSGSNSDTNSRTYDSSGRVATSTSALVTSYSYDYGQHTVTAVTTGGGAAACRCRRASSGRPTTGSDGR